MGGVRSGSELASVEDPAWPDLAARFARTKNARVIAISRPAGLKVLHRLQVTARSTLGALALNCGGVILDYGWLRILGGGGEGLWSLAAANQLEEPVPETLPPGSLVVALDVLGGIFAINGGDLPFAAAEVGYWAPDALAWEATGIGHSDFVAWAPAGIDEFYADYRWPGWQDEIKAVPLDQGLSIYPPLFTKEGQDIAAASRRAISFRELVTFHRGVAAQVGGEPDNTALAV